LIQVRFADPLTDRDNNTLPADHRAQTERDGDRDLYPAGNELGRVVEGLFVGGQRRDVLGIEVAFLVLHQEADRLWREIHVIADIFHLIHRHFGDRAGLRDLVGDIAHQDGQ
jgi:hypothetical protein